MLYLVNSASKINNYFSSTVIVYDFKLSDITYNKDKLELLKIN